MSLASRVLMGVFLMTSGSAAYAQAAVESPSEIDRQVETFLARQNMIGLSAVSLDPRLRLQRCATPLAIEIQATDWLAVRCPALGWRIRVTLLNARGEMSPNRELPVVRRGETIELIYQGSGFTASSSGKAQRDGAIGQTISVQATDGRSVVQAKVVAAGRAEALP